MERWQRAQWRGLFGRPILTLGLIGAACTLECTWPRFFTFYGIPISVQGPQRWLLALGALNATLPWFICWVAQHTLMRDLGSPQLDELRVTPLRPAQLFFARTLPLSIWLTVCVLLGKGAATWFLSWRILSPHLDPFVWGWLVGINTVGRALLLGFAAPALMCAVLVQRRSHLPAWLTIVFPALLLSEIPLLCVTWGFLTERLTQETDAIWLRLLNSVVGRAILYELILIALLTAACWFYAAPRFLWLYEQE